MAFKSATDLKYEEASKKYNEFVSKLVEDYGLIPRGFIARTNIKTDGKEMFVGTTLELGEVDLFPITADEKKLMGAMKSMKPETPNESKSIIQEPRLVIKK